MFYPTPFNLPSGPEPIKTWDYHPVKVRGKKEETSNQSISVQEIKKPIFENKQEKTKKAKTRRKSNNKRKSNKNK